ncbi:MAG: hypothetical protein ACD_72C00526G0001 [uncultured bacterium]|nr:MAG: hypothetical protein ACD_72C00526G0001 [uncultured bacterium]
MSKQLAQPSQPAKNNKLLFILGRETQLSLAEILSLFELKKIKFNIVKQTENKLLIDIDTPIDYNYFINRLGGTVKIGELFCRLDNPVQNLTDALNKLIPSGKIEFSVNNFKSVGIETKKRLKQIGRSARYIEVNNTATIIYNNLIKGGADIEVMDKEAYLTKAIQPIDQFTLRDFGRPGRDDHSGMLPPKLAMMMINLAAVPEEATICDPFCGSGTIVTEAMLMGYKNIIGSDVSEIAMSDTAKNIAWLKMNFKVDNTLHVETFQADALSISKKVELESVDAIIAEPFLGKPLHGTESLPTLELQASELKFLYVKAFAELYKILKTNGVVIFIIPRFKTKAGWVTINCESEILKLGFTNTSILPDQKHLLYWRDTQHVGREIWRFKKV